MNPALRSVFVAVVAALGVSLVWTGVRAVRTGVARTRGGGKIHRGKNPGLFWFVVGAQWFFALVLFVSAGVGLSGILR